MRNAVENWNELMGRRFEFIGNNLGGVVGTIVKLHYSGSWNDSITFVEVEEDERQGIQFHIDNEQVVKEYGHRLITPDSITQLREIK